MADRYTRLFTLPENLYAQTAPVLIAAGALLKDNQTGGVLAQLKFRSISSKPIKAIKVSITGYDMAKEIVCREEHQYLDLQVRRDQFWGSKEAIVLPNRSVRSFDAAVSAVFFEDGSSQVCDRFEWEPLSEQLPLDTKLWDVELIRQYKLDTTEASNFVPLVQKDIWLCACGEINRLGEACNSCGNELKKLNSMLDLEGLRWRKNERLREELERSNAEEAVRERQSKILKKCLLICLPLIIAAAAGIFFFMGSGRSQKEYDAANELLSQSRYAEAARAFDALGEYQDSVTKAAEARMRAGETAAYNNALKLLEEKKYAEARKAFVEIGGYQDAWEKADEAQYLLAMELLESGSHDEARQLFEELGEYKDSGEILKHFVMRRLSQRVSYDNDCAGPLTTEFSYDSSGKLISETRKYSEYPQYNDQTLAYTYSSDGSLVKGDGLVSYHYDKHGNYLGQNGLQLYEYVYGYNADGSLHYCDAYTIEEQAFLWEYIYDEKGNPIQYQADGMAAEIFTNEYDGERILKQDRYSPAPETALIGCTKYEYNADGELIKLTVLDAEGNSHITEYTYGMVYAPQA